MTLPPREDGEVAQHLLAPIAEAGGLDGQHVDRPAQLVDDERGERLAVDVLGHDEEGLAEGDGLLEGREQIRDGRDLLVGDEDGGLLEDRLHLVGVGDEIGRDVAPVELHALDVFLLEPGRLAFLDRDHAVLADLVHDLGDQLADFRVGGADGGHVGDVLARRDGPSLRLERLDDRIDGLLQAALDDHRVGAGGDVPETLGHEGLGQHDRGRGAVPGHVVGLDGDLAQELGAHVLERLVERDVARDRHPVVGDGGRAVLLVEGDVAALGAQGDAHGVREAVDASHEGVTSGLVVEELLGHGWWFLPSARLPGGERTGPIRLIDA